ncbi:MAG TPA: hypothetical protein VJY34_01315 [Roseiarcus sp.]|nr:hypothetical protein [Roseiarcus sp.]
MLDQVDERLVGVLDDGGRLDVNRIRLVAVVIEHLLFKPIGVGCQTISQSAYRRRRRRTDAPHERQRPPERQPPVAQLPARLFNDSEAVVEDRVV